MSLRDLNPELVDKIRSITGKRSRVVVDHIVKHGNITTEDLERYGYKHPPRAVRDVREQGLPLEQFWTKNSEGRKIAGYRFGDPKDVRNDRLGGRRVFAKDFIQQVFDSHAYRCAVCRAHLEGRYLQLDHRVPYEVAGDSSQNSADAFMALCGSCNRAKSWSCEHCDNWTTDRLADTCATCYWANPESYEHVATVPSRRIDMAWHGSEVREHDELRADALSAGIPLAEFIKSQLSRHRKTK